MSAGNVLYALHILKNPFFFKMEKTASLLVRDPISKHQRRRPDSDVAAACAAIAFIKIKTPFQRAFRLKAAHLVFQRFIFLIRYIRRIDTIISNVARNARKQVAFAGPRETLCGKILSHFCLQSGYRIRADIRSDYPRGRKLRNRNADAPAPAAKVERRIISLFPLTRSIAARATTTSVSCRGISTFSST